MRKASDIMKELGFREDASDDVKIAFIKNLTRAAYGVDVQAPPNVVQQSFSFEKPQPPKPVAAPRLDEQLSFDLGELTTVRSEKSQRRSS